MIPPHQDETLAERKCLPRCQHQEHPELDHNDITIGDCLNNAALSILSCRELRDTIFTQRHIAKRAGSSNEPLMWVERPQAAQEGVLNRDLAVDG